MKPYSVAWMVCASCLISFAQPAEREVDDKQKEREEWFYGQRSAPAGRIPTGARINAIQEIQRIDRAARLRRSPSGFGARLAATLDAANWTLIGPKPTDLGSTYVTAGRVNAIAIDPRDSNTVYIGAAAGGVWKTTDGGLTWQPLTDDQPSLAMGALVLDPSNPDIVYAGTGEENFAQDSYYGAGILKSTDRGATWTNIVGPFLRDKIGALAIHPTNTQVLLCSSGTGIYRSTDGAATWTRTLTGTGTSVVFDPTNGNIAYAALGNIFGNAVNGVYRSTDGGQNWVRISGAGANSLPTSNVGRIELALAPSTPTTLYAGIQNVSTSALLGIYKTTDSGATWNSTPAPNLCPGAASQCWYDMTIHVNPKNADIVFAAGSLTVIRTLDGGATWGSLNLTGPNRVEMHVDEHNMAFTPDGSKLYIVNDGGVYSTTDISTAQVNWTELNDTLALTQFYPGLSIHPTNPNTSFGGAQDNGTQRFGGNASWNNVTCGDGGFATIDAAVPNIVYAACQEIDIRRTTNGGANWLSSQYGIDSADGDRVSFIPPLVMDPSNSQTLYFGTQRVWQSRDGGGKWLAISPDLTGRNVASANIRVITVAPSDNNTVYAGSSDIGRISTSSTSTTRIQVTTNALAAGGATWTNRSTGLPPRAVTQITVDPIDAATAYATFSGFTSSTDTQGHVFKTTNSGAGWTDISGNLPNIPVDDLVVDPDNPDTLYIATDAGVMVTTDAGATWSTLGNGLPRVVVHSLVLHRPSRTLRAATHGRSVWDILVPTASASLQPTITALSPSTVNSPGPGFTLSVTGSNFGSGSVLRWNGQNRPTTVADNTHLTAEISAADIAQTGRVSIDVLNRSRGGGASLPKAFSVGPAPVTTPASFVSAANPTGGSVLAPGSIASLYGTNLAGGIVTTDSAPPLPFSLGGTTLTISTSSAAFFFVSPGQINVHIPFFVVNGPITTSAVITAGLLSTTTTVSLRPFAPSLFTTNSQGTGQASVLIAGTATIAAPSGTFPGSRPAKIGEFISIYCTGLGAVRNTPGTGRPSPSSPLATTLTNPTVTIGNASAPVSFSGLAPGFVGLYQVNAQIPDGVTAGAAIPVVLSIGGFTSNTATIAVQ